MIHLFVEPGRLEVVGEALSKFEEVTDVFEVTGEYDIIIIVNTTDVTSFRKFIADKLLTIPGIRSAVSSIVLHVYKKGGKVTYE
ncbi:MAG: Lrp/AsnC ligand binding domain-containing protein [Thaumarchaeota archaeon]|nr:Lrp/AsnC ligand binding domain-containing protein [Candidatus Calditenuaceae archaeon]MDW8187587.1 Lrp/AsnC ligand binding domain-containing protein [Nitrososphaerota archaeon]